MARWDDGYVTDVVYTTNFYREITPTWLNMTCQLLGHRPPDLTGPFRYADLGCGNGFTTLAVAASCPQAEVWGFDFNPAHIEFASGLAARAGLTNVHFTETSFADLAALPEPALPEFDFMVSHGVLSWISPENRHHLVATIGRRLKPGGVSYLSYNVTTGWTSMVPVRALMRALAEASPERTDLAVPGVLDFIDRLKQGGAAFFTANPAIETRLKDIRLQDARYIAHEYLNQDWHPLAFAEIAGEMAEAKCRFIGSATLAENIDSVSVPAGVAPILAETRDPFLRETLRDIGCAQAFRRDLYRKGTAPMPAAEQQAMIEALSLIGLGQAVPEGGATFATPIGSVTGRPEVYRPLLEQLAQGPMTLGQLRASATFAARPLIELLQALTLLVAGGYAHPMLPDAVVASGGPTARALNAVIARANMTGTDLPRMVAPVIGSVVQVDVLEALVVGELLGGQMAEVDPLATEVLALLARGGRNVQKEGKPVTDVVEARGIVADAIRTVLERRLPVFRSLGVVE
jgi:SAM-dependent methyltransferase